MSARTRLLLIACVALAGCAALLPKLVAPQLTVNGVNFEGGDLLQQQLQLSLHVTNPNDRAIAVRGITVNLDLAGVPFAMGVSDAAFVLPAHGETDFALNVSANVSNALGVLAAGMAHRAVDYRVYGQVHLGQGLVRTLQFSHNGRVRL